MTRLQQSTQNGFLEQEQYYNNKLALHNLRRQLNTLKRPFEFKKTGESVIAENIVRDLKVALLEHNQI